MSSSPIRPSSSLSAHQRRSRNHSHNPSPQSGIINLASPPNTNTSASGGKGARNSPRKRAPRQRQATPKASEPASAQASGTTTPVVPSNLTIELAANATEGGVEGAEAQKKRRTRTRPASKSASSAQIAADVFDDVDHHGLAAPSPSPAPVSSANTTSKKSKQKGQAPPVGDVRSEAQATETLLPPAHVGGKAAQKKNPKTKRGGRKAAAEQRKRSGEGGSSDENADTSLEINIPTQSSFPSSAAIPISVIPTSPSGTHTTTSHLPTTPAPRHRSVPLVSDDEYVSRSAPTTGANSPFLHATRPKHNRTHSNLGQNRGGVSGDEWDMPKALRPEVLSSLTWQQQAALSSASAGNSPVPGGDGNPRRSRSLRSRDSVGVAGAIATPPRRSARQTNSPFASSNITNSDGRRSVPPPSTSTVTPTSAMDAMTWQQAFLRSSPAPTALSKSSVYDVFHPSGGTASAPVSPAKNVGGGGGKKSRSSSLEAGMSNLSISKPSASKKAPKVPLPPAYAGPQFHNSPSAATLPPPKFLSGASKAVAAESGLASGGGTFSVSAPNLNGWGA